MTKRKKKRLLLGMFIGASALISGCGASSDTRDIVYIGHNQAADHPTNIALLAFEEFIESRLGINIMWRFIPVSF